jgi:hypothetical protein
MDHCPCGKPLHYTNALVKRLVDGAIERLGEYIPVSVGSRTWNVSRHYIALHGIRAVELPSLGFKEITSGQSND